MWRALKWHRCIQTAHGIGGTDAYGMRLLLHKSHMRTIAAIEDKTARVRLLLPNIEDEKPGMRLLLQMCASCHEMCKKYPQGAPGCTHFSDSRGIFLPLRTAPRPQGQKCWVHPHNLKGCTAQQEVYHRCAHVVVGYAISQIWARFFASMLSGQQLCTSGKECDAPLD